MPGIDCARDAGEPLLSRAGDAGSGDGRIACDALVEAIHRLGIRVEDLEIALEGELATVSGRASHQEDREKALLVVANTRGVARVEDRIEVAETAPAARYYRVQPEDTLSKIARAMYGDAMKYPLIFEGNRPMLKYPDQIYPGQVLRIPPLPTI